MNHLRSWILPGLLLLGSCQTHTPTPPPLPPPTTLFDVSYYLGNALSGPTAGAVPTATPIDCLTVHVTFLALENRPNTPYPSIGSKAVFFSSTNGGSAVLPAADLTRNANINTNLRFAQDLPAMLRDSHAGRITPMGSLNGVLPPGATARFAALDPDTLTDPVTGVAVRRSVQILVSRPADSNSHPQIALVLNEVIKASNLQTETAICDLPAQDHTNTAIVVPFRFDDATSRAVAILIQISPGSNDRNHIAATANCLAALGSGQSTTQPALTTGEASARSAVTAAMQSLKSVETRRSSLAFLADQTGASLCEDLTMEADDAVLAQLVHDIQANAPTTRESNPDVGWLLDHAALQLLTKMSDDAANGTGKMPAELTAILTNQTGEVGRHVSALDELLRGLTSRQDLDNRLLAQNTIYLEDSSPASRVRAYDWLNARHHAPAGYDPLGPGKARRAALEQAAGTP
jgi:hypothetical protein